MYYNLEFFLTLAVIVTGVSFVVARVMNREHRLFVLIHGFGSFFFVLLAVLIIRSFIAEPFRIPSGSMLPTLEVGDFILVNKFTYGLRLPVLRNKILAVGEPQRGDVAVFKYPANPEQDFIKRIIAVPGDKLRYLNKTLYVNNEQVKGQVVPGGNQTRFQVLTEDLFGHLYLVQNDRNAYSLSGSWVVPEGHYFVMGDNRDNSNDSRRWGFVPESNLLGRAFLIWMHWNWNSEHSFNFDRVGNRIE